MQALTSPNTDAMTSARLCDVSGRGVRLTTALELHVHQRFSLTLKTRHGRCALFYAIRRARALPDGRYEIAAESLGVLGPDTADRPEAVILALLAGEQ